MEVWYVTLLFHCLLENMNILFFNSEVNFVTPVTRFYIISGHGITSTQLYSV